MNCFPQSGSDSDWKEIVAGGTFSAGLKEDGSLWTWGLGGYGELGTGTNQYADVPTQVGSETWLTISGRYFNLFGIKTDGSLWSWGYNNYGQLGDGTTVDKDVPTPVLVDQNIVAVSPSGLFTIALDESGVLHGFGSNYDGQFGNGTTSPFGQPILIPESIDNCPTAATTDYLTEHFAIYPNPAVTYITIVTAENTAIEQLFISDITGKTVLAQNGNTTQIDVENLPAGMYFLEIKTGSGSSHHKFIKE